MFECIDPTAPDFNRLPVYGCGTMPTVPSRCALDVQSQWVVEDTEEAFALANAVSNCSGGDFEVDWRGHVLVNTTLWVVDGTSLTITGGNDAVVDGGGLTRPFVVVNASLQLGGLAVVDGTALFGGGIFAGGSKLTLNGTRLSNCTAELGGAAYIDSESVVSFTGENEVSYNSAYFGGGLYIDGRSNASWEAFHFVGNRANISYTIGGAAVLLRGGSTLYWSGNTIFRANYDNALAVLSNSNVFWDGQTIFADGYGDAAVRVSEHSTLSWSGNTLFTNNTESHCIVVEDAHVSWSGETSFVSNSGGRDYVSQATVSIRGGSVSFSGRTQFVDNMGDDCGGAFYVEGGSLQWSGQTTFRNNTAGDGGAVCVDGGNVSWSGQTLFDRNLATFEGVISGSRRGGALFIDSDAIVTWDGETTFAGNRAMTDGE